MTRRTYKYYDLVMAAFVAVLLCSNLIGAAKIAAIGPFNLGLFTIPSIIFGSGVLFFPISYIFGDILTEVYGYARARKVVWAGFGALIFASFMSWIVVALRPAPGWPDQPAYVAVFGSTWRIVLASLTAFFVGEFANSFVLAKLKIKTEGKYLWVRTIGSTIVGEAVDSLIFYPVAFYGHWSNTQLVTVMITNYLIKLGWETVITPFTYLVVNFLKRAENEDFYDRKTNFTPFSIEV